MSIKKIVIFVVVAYMGYSWFFAGSTPTSPPTSNDSPTTSMASANTVPSYARRATDNSWPEISQTQAIRGSGDNLLADNFYILLDASGSMEKRKCSGNASKMQVAISALSQFLNNIPSDANVGFALFAGGKYRQLAPLAPIGELNFAKLKSRIKPGGSTPLRSAITFAYQQLTTQGQKQLGYGRYQLIVITDGIASDGQDPSRIVQKMLTESPVNLHTIGFCIGTQHVLNQPGRVEYRAANNPDELAKGLDSVLAEAPQFDLGRFSN